MSVSGFANYEDYVTQIAPVEPSKLLVMPLLVYGEGTVEKTAILHCLPGDLAADLHIFEDNHPAFWSQAPFDLMHEGNRAVRVLQDQEVSHEVEMNDGRVIEFILAHRIGEYSLSLS